MSAESVDAGAAEVVDKGAAASTETGSSGTGGEVEEKTPAPYEPPEDLGAFPDDEPDKPAPGGKDAAAPSPAPSPAPAPSYRGEPSDPWGKPVTYSGEDVYAKGSTVVEDHIRERVGALAGTVSQVVGEQSRQIAELRAELASIKGRPTAPPRAFVEREHKNAVAFVSGRLREFSADPAWGNQKVKGYMEAGVRQYLKDAAKKALSGDMSDYSAIMDEGFLDGVFYTAKVKAGYKGGLVPGDVSNPQAQLEGVRSRGVAPADDDIEIDSETKAALKAAHVSIADYKKKIRDSQKWNKERS